MTDDPRGDLDDWPSELRSLDALERVIAWLRAMPIPIQSKRKRLYHWAKSLGATVDLRYYQRLE